jgi:hypothetical protein
MWVPWVTRHAACVGHASASFLRPNCFDRRSPPLSRQSTAQADFASPLGVVNDRFLIAPIGFSIAACGSLAGESLYLNLSKSKSS